MRLGGNIVTPTSAGGISNGRDMVNILWWGFLAIIPVFINSIAMNITALNLGNYGWILPIAAMILKSLAAHFQEN